MPGIAHTPVMLEEVLSFLVPSRGDELMLDCTLGEGGHAEAFLARYPGLRYVGIDADPAIQAKARERLGPFAGRAAFLLGYFDEVLAAWNDLGLSFGEGSGPFPGASLRPSLVLFDLGISMFHFAESGRGFGHGKDEELDMRLSPEAPRSAAALLAEEGEEEIARIIYEYGEERMSRRIAKAIVEARRRGGVRTTGALAELVWGAVPAEYRHGRIHPATRTFQALRIAVNDELGRAERGLRSAAALLAPGGLLAVISFHSLEDRVAKNVFRELAGRKAPAARPRRGAEAFSSPYSNSPIPLKEGGAPPLLELLTKKPIGAERRGDRAQSRLPERQAARRPKDGTMKRLAFFAILLSIPLLLLAVAWQAGRFDSLAAEARRLESSQESWVEENLKLAAGIRVLSSRERAAAVAQGLGLEKAGPERRLRIVLPGAATGGSGD